MTKKLIKAVFLMMGTMAASVLVATEVDHSKMDHSKHMVQMADQNAPSSPAPMSASPLTEAGNAVFGTIQEAIKQLDANPNTDWTKVDLEGLRQHLIDMENFTIHVDVISSKDIEKGVVVIVKPTTDAAKASLTRALAAHPGMLKQESGWDMTTKAEGDSFILTIETDKPEEVARLRALGYIGVMALGDHHQVHHWGMASGNNPHEHAH